MKLELFDDFVAINPIDASGTSQGGIILPETAQQKPYRGIVLACGPGRQLDTGQVVPIKVKEGDQVIYGRHSGIEQRIGETEVTFLQERFIFGKVVPE